MLGSVLVAIDGSPGAGAALDEAAEIAEQARSRITLVAVAPNVSRTVAIWAPIPLGSAQEECDASWAQLLRTAADRLPRSVPVTQLLRHGDPALSILGELRRAHYDLVVLGSRGRGPLGSLVFGSVGDRVLHRSPMPVLIVRQDRVVVERLRSLTRPGTEAAVGPVLGE